MKTSDSVARTVRVEAAVAVIAAAVGEATGVDVVLDRRRSRVHDAHRTPPLGLRGRMPPPLALAAGVVVLDDEGAPEAEIHEALERVRSALVAENAPADPRDVFAVVERARALRTRHAGAVRSLTESMMRQATHGPLPRIVASASLVESIVRHGARPGCAGRRSGHEEATVGAREVRGLDRFAQIRAGLPRREYRDAPGGAALGAPARGAATTEAPKIIMGVPLESDSEDLGGFYERIHRHAFDRTLFENRAGIVGLWQHDAGAVLGRLSNGTMTATVLADRLEAVVTLDPEDPSHVGYARRVARGDVTSASFGFECRKDRWEERPDGTILRTLLDVTLHDISVVTYPAYLASSAASRSAAHRLSPAVSLSRLRAKKLARITAAHGLAGVR